MTTQETFPGRGPQSGNQDKDRISETEETAFPGGRASGTGMDEETDMDEELDETVADTEDEMLIDEPVLNEEDMEETNLKEEDEDDIEWEEPKR